MRWYHSTRNRTPENREARLMWECNVNPAEELRSWQHNAAWYNRACRILARWQRRYEGVSA